MPWQHRRTYTHTYTERENVGGYLCNIPFVLSSEHPLMYTTVGSNTRFRGDPRSCAATQSLSLSTQHCCLDFYLCSSHSACAGIVIVQFAKTETSSTSNVREKRAPLDISFTNTHTHRQTHQLHHPYVCINLSLFHARFEGKFIVFSWATLV